MIRNLYAKKTTNRCAGGISSYHWAAVFYAARADGGWVPVKALRRSGAYQKGDERILGDSDFVEGVLSQAEEQFQQKYRMKEKG